MTPLDQDLLLLQADWLQELPEDLDVCIAQRDFEGAVDLVEKGRAANEVISHCNLMYYLLFIIIYKNLPHFHPQ